MTGFQIRASDGLRASANHFLGIHHHEAHLYSPWTSGNPLAADFSAFEPNVSLIVSGGHTMLVHVRNEIETSPARVPPWTTPPGNVSTQKTGKSSIGLPLPRRPGKLIGSPKKRKSEGL